MLIREFRIPLPMTVEEYQIAQAFSVTEMSKNETGGGEGVEFIQNKQFTGFPLFFNQYSEGQYTYKIYHLASRIPSYISLFFDKNVMDIHEEAWNAYPYCRTVITNPGYMKENFSVIIESLHVSDRGEEANVHMLNEVELGMRDVTFIDIGNDPFTNSNYSRNKDPSIFVSEKTGRGPLKEDWISRCEPVMTCYKVVRAHFKWFGIQKKVESFILETEHKLFLRFHRQLFCWIDRWYGLTMEEVRNVEIETKEQLKREINVGPKKSMEGHDN